MQTTHSLHTTTPPPPPPLSPPPKPPSPSTAPTLTPSLTHAPHPLSPPATLPIDSGRRLQRLSLLDLPHPRKGDGPACYLNRYRMGWLGYALFVKQSIDTLERIFKRGRNNLGDIKFVPLADRQAPLPVLRFQVSDDGVWGMWEV